MEITYKGIFNTSTIYKGFFLSLFISFFSFATFLFFFLSFLKTR